jgi:predicted phosphodiesterase
MIIGLLSDTHLPNLIRDLDELGPETVEFFKSVDLIFHGGDLTTPRVLDWLEQFAPVVCSTGNNDPIPDPRSEEVQTL